VFVLGSFEDVLELEHRLALVVAQLHPEAGQLGDALVHALDVLLRLGAHLGRQRLAGGRLAPALDGQAQFRRAALGERLGRQLPVLARKRSALQPTSRAAERSAPKAVPHSLLTG
jgi:hypothetical protein